MTPQSSRTFICVLTGFSCVIEKHPLEDFYSLNKECTFVLFVFLVLLVIIHPETTLRYNSFSKTNLVVELNILMCFFLNFISFTTLLTRLIYLGFLYKCRFFNASIHEIVMSLWMEVFYHYFKINVFVC